MSRSKHKCDHSFAPLHSGLTADIIRKHVAPSEVVFRGGVLGLKSHGIIQLCRAIEDGRIPSNPEQKSNACYLRETLSSITYTPEKP